jgi:hypothetical protein
MWTGATVAFVIDVKEVVAQVVHAFLGLARPQQNKLHVRVDLSSALHH